MQLREGGYLHAHLPNLSKPTRLLCVLVRSDSMRKHVTMPQGIPPAGTVQSLFAPHLCVFKRIFYFGIPWTKV